MKKPQQERALLQVMQREIERLEEERVHLKTENRKLAVQLGHKAARLGLEADDLRAVQEYRDALRERRRNSSFSLTPRKVSCSTFVIDEFDSTVCFYFSFFMPIYLLDILNI